MGRIAALTGNSAMAHAFRQVEPDVYAAYPITPSTQVTEEFSEYVADGLVNTEFVPTESEHSAMSACIGAVAAGARAATTTSSQGLALMHEVLYIAASYRLPMVMAVVNRALSGPLNIQADHSDTMGSRDCGWIQLYSEGAQEAYDNLIQAVVISEQEEVRLPVMVCMDGFIISHSLERVEVEDDALVKAFIGEHKALYPLLDVDHPVTYGPNDLADYYTEHRRQQTEAMEKAGPVILQVASQWEKLTGRSYGYFEAYRLEEADYVIVAMGSAAGTIKDAVDELRQSGCNAGLLKPRVFRPFPGVEIVEALKRARAVAVLDRAEAFGALGGPLFTDVTAALYEQGQRPPCVNYIYGLGGRDVSLADIFKVYHRLEEVAKTGTPGPRREYLNLREEDELPEGALQAG